MKWAQTKKVLDDDEVDDQNERNTFFKEYASKDDLEKDLMDKSKFVEWASFDTFPLHRKAQRKYEIYCGGFLYYHDVVFKQYPKGAGYEYPEKEGPGIAPKWKKYPNDKFEHIIYLRWLKEDGKEYIESEDVNVGSGEKKKEKSHKVIIYINPTPPEFNANPPTPPPPPPPES